MLTRIVDVHLWVDEAFLCAEIELPVWLWDLKVPFLEYVLV